MNVLFLINHAGKGGSEKYVHVLASYLIKKNNKVFFIYNEEGLLVSNMKKLGAITEQLVMKGPFDFKASNYIADYAQVNKIDIIHTQFQRENYLALLAKRKYPDVSVIYTSHIILCDNFLRKQLNKIMLKNIHAIIAVCTKSKQTLIENNYPEDKIKIIFNGVPFKNYVHNVKNSTMRKDYKIPVDEFVFVTVARFSKEKGMMFLLESANLLLTMTDLPFKIMLVGDGEQMDDLKQYLEQNENLAERVILTGFLDDVASILIGSDCYINSSMNEALSLAILEAMSKALPVIATRVGGNTDIINEQTDCGILVRYDSKVQMAQAMEKMMSNEKFYKKCSVNAIEAIKNKFDIEKKLEQTYEIYQRS